MDSENKLTIPQIVTFKQQIVILIDEYINDYHLEKTFGYPKEKIHNQKILEQIIAHFDRLREIYLSTHSDDDDILSDADDTDDVQIDDLVDEDTSSGEEINHRGYSSVMQHRTYPNRTYAMNSTHNMLPTHHTLPTHNMLPTHHTLPTHHPLLLSRQAPSADFSQENLKNKLNDLFVDKSTIVTMFSSQFGPHGEVGLL